MSADKQRLKSAIQQIAERSPGVRALLKANDNKGGKAASAGVGVSEAEEARICCDGSTSDHANPGTDERDPDAADAGQTGLDSTDPADLKSGDGTLSGVTDCATGQPICFDGTGFIPPDGWEDGVPTLEVVDSRPTCGTLTVEDAPVFHDSRLYAVLCPPAGDAWEVLSLCFGGAGCGVDTPYLYKSAATYSEPPAKEAWPSDGCVNLAIKGGKIVGSKYDPENDGSYSAPRDSIELCSGDDKISLAPAANGGFKTINPTTDNGYLYNNKNERIAHIDGNEYSDPSV